MKTFLAGFIVSFIAVVAITPFLIKVGKKYNLIDESNRRKVHRGAIPRIGGIGITIGTLLPIVALSFVANDPSQLFFDGPENAIVVIGGGLAIAIMGLVDDIWGLPAKIKLLFQFLIAGAAYYFGFSMIVLNTPFGPLDLGLFSAPATILWIVGIINAFNLIDGLDGLSSGIAFFVSITLFIMSIYHIQLFPAIISSCLAGAVAGFLIYNFNPAKIFMGDSGSMFIGYILAIISLRGASKGGTLVSILIPLMAMGLPILDTVMAFVRRIVRNQSIFLADKQHIHHLLLLKGWTQRKVVTVLYGVSLLFAMLAMLTIFMHDMERFLIFMVFIIVVVIFISKLGYMEMIQSRYRLRKHNPLENELVKFFADKFALFTNEDISKSLISFDKIEGVTMIAAKGDQCFTYGKTTSPEFLDVEAENEVYLRLYWNGVIPAITSKESAMFEIIAKVIFSNIERTKNDE